jgi:hypothetical protein
MTTRMRKTRTKTMRRSDGRAATCGVDYLPRLAPIPCSEFVSGATSGFLHWGPHPSP